MKTNKKIIEKLFPSVYITLISILLGFAVEDVVTQLRAIRPIDIYSSLAAVGILSTLIAGWIAFSFVSMTQIRLPKVSDSLSVFFLAFSWYLMSSALGMDIWWFFGAVSIYLTLSLIAVIYIEKPLTHNLSNKRDVRAYRWLAWVLLPGLVIYPVAAWLSAKQILTFGIEIALLLYFPASNVLWTFLFFKAWRKLVSAME